MTLDRFFIRLRQLMWANVDVKGELPLNVENMNWNYDIFVSCKGKAINYYWIFKYHSFPLFPLWKWKRSAGEENFIIYFYGNITFYLYFGIENVLKRQQSPERYFYLFRRCSYSWAFALNNFLAYPLQFCSFLSPKEIPQISSGLVSTGRNGCTKPAVYGVTSATAPTRVYLFSRNDNVSWRRFILNFYDDKFSV